MTQNRISPSALLVLLIISGAGLYVLSGLGGQQVFEQEVSLHLERARRILDGYSAELDYQSQLVEQFQNLDLELMDPDDLSDDALDDYQEIHTRLWENFQPMDWQDNPRKARANYNNISGQMEKGRNNRENLLKENQRLLNQALAAVHDAGAVEVGDQSGRDHAEVNRLEALIQYHLALSDRVSASLLRVEAIPYQRMLIEAVQQINAAQPAKTFIADSHIDQQIDQLKEKIEQTRTELIQQRRDLKKHDRTIRDIQSRVSDAQNKSDDARKHMDELIKLGLDFSDPHGAQTFGVQLRQLNQKYRTANSEVQALEAGRYSNAQIDATGDYLNGRYVENGSVHDLTIEHGLNHYQNERRIASDQIDGLQLLLENLLDDATRMESMKDSCAMAEIDAAKKISEARKTANEAWDIMTEIDAEAYDIEDKAIDLLNRSAKTSERAARGVNDWVNDARDQTQGLSPQAQELSAFQMRTNDAWMGGHITAQAADARIVMAWIHYDRYITHTNNARILRVLPDSIRLSDAHAEDELVSATEARDAGAEMIQQASTSLKKAHKDTERHWTLVAQQADAAYLLALFGDESYVDDAIEGYRNAIKGRENQTFVKRIADRLTRLENRK